MSYIEEILDRVSITDVLEHYGVYPKRGTNIYRCFVHDDHKPSAHIDKRNGKFYCFVCHQYFDTINIVQHFENCDIITAIKILDKIFQLNLFKELTKEEKKQLLKQKYLREKKEKDKMLWINFEKLALSLIIKKLRFWGDIAGATHPTRKEIRTDSWENDHLFFLSLSEQERLETLYYIICGIPHEPNSWDYIYGDNKKKIFRKLNSGEIDI